MSQSKLGTVKTQPNSDFLASGSVFLNTLRRLQISYFSSEITIFFLSKDLNSLCQYEQYGIVEEKPLTIM